MSKKRGFFTQLIRHLIQFAAFILFPGLFIMVFSAVRDLLTAFMDGSFSFNGLFPQIILVFMVFLITMLWGRFFCGFLCSFGMIQELIFFFSKRIILKKVQIPKRFDYIMKFLKYVILVLITAGVWLLALPVDSSWNPWGVFGMLVSGNFSLVSSSIPTVGFALLLAIAAGSLFVERFFCRYLCPLGALLAVVSGKRLYKIRRQSDSCTNCGLCTRSCSMGIEIPENDAVVSRECIQCMQCLAICPKDSLSVNPAAAMAGTACSDWRYSRCWKFGILFCYGNCIATACSKNRKNEKRKLQRWCLHGHRRRVSGNYRGAGYRGGRIYFRYYGAFIFG